MPQPRVRRFVELPYGLYQQVVEAARRQELPVNTIMVQALQEWLERHAAQREEGAGGNPSQA